MQVLRERKQAWQTAEREVRWYSFMDGESAGALSYFHSAALIPSQIQATSLQILPVMTKIQLSVHTCTVTPVHSIGIILCSRIMTAQNRALHNIMR